MSALRSHRHASCWQVQGRSDSSLAEMLFVKYAIELPFVGDVGTWVLFLKYANDLVFV